VRGLDVSVFRWINGWSFGWERLFVFFSEATKRADVRIGLVVILIALIAAGPTTRKATLLAVAAVGLANTLADGLKWLFKMPRPCNDLMDVTLHLGYDGKLIHLGSFGTASSHSANMAAVAFVLVYHFKWWGTPWIAVALLTGLARIYVGVHYPSQVLLGYLVGVACALIVVKTWEAFVRRRRMAGDLDATGDAATG
jgi:undecaprenyl-diphosphatase